MTVVLSRQQLLLKKANIVDNILSMNRVWPNISWSLCLVPAKENSEVELEEELEMREGTGLRRGGASCQEIRPVAFMFSLKLLFSYILFSILFPCFPFLFYSHSF